MASLHLTYHSVDAKYTGPNELGGPTGVWGWGVSLQHSGFVTQLRVVKGSV